MSEAFKDRGLGGRPHKKDDRDWLYRDIPNERLNAVASYSAEPNRRLWGMHGPEWRLDQGREGTCVAHAAVHHMLNAPKLHTEFERFQAVDDAHVYARELYLAASGDTTYQQGMYGRDMCDELVKRGHVGAYYRLVSIDEIIEALLSIGPVFFASPWYYSQYYTDNQATADSGHSFIRVNPDAGLAGFHMYELTAVDLAPDVGPAYVRMENSWSQDWFDNGTARIKIDDLPILYDGDAYVLTETAF